MKMNLLVTCIKNYPHSCERFSSYKISSFIDNTDQKNIHPPNDALTVIELIVTEVEKLNSRSNYTYIPINISTQHSTLSPHNFSSFGINLHQPTFSSQYIYSSLPLLASQNTHADAITRSTWYVDLYIFKLPEDTSLILKRELLLF